MQTALPRERGDTRPLRRARRRAPAAVHAPDLLGRTPSGKVHEVNHQRDDGSARWRGGRIWKRSRDRFVESVGGFDHARMVLVLAAVLALDSADKGAVSAVAVPLKRGLGIDNAGLGLMATIVSLVGLVFTFPAGVLMDRAPRLRLLGVSVVLWAGAMAVTATATSFTYLLLSRIALGVVVAAAGPAIASLTGDLFADDLRGKVYGYILTGELLGTGVGILLVGEVTAFVSWRWAFVVLAIPAGALALAVWRTPEPIRRRADEDRGRNFSNQWRAVKRVLSVRTNVLLIVASAFSYFFFTGLRTFAIVFLHDHFGLGQAESTALLPLLGLGGLSGVLTGGRLADHLQRRGHRAARVTVAAACLFVAAGLLVPGFATSSPVIAVGLFTVAGVALGAANPAIDAARLDIMVPELWGRAESVRTILRTGGEAAAPVTFGALAGWFAGPDGRGLQITFLLMLVPLVVGGVVLWWARRSYPDDVAAAHVPRAQDRPGRA